jgi:hypothetical protein
LSLCQGHNDSALKETLFCFYFRDIDWVALVFQAFLFLRHRHWKLIVFLELIELFHSSK